MEIRDTWENFAFTAYIDTACLTGTLFPYADSTTPNEAGFVWANVTRETRALMLESFRALVADCEAAGVDPRDLDPDDFGRDAWLTREGHGCGFWDGDWPEPAASILAEVAESAGRGGCFYISETDPSELEWDPAG